MIFPWKHIPDVLTRAESKRVMLTTCTSEPIKGEVFRVAASYWESGQAVDLVCVGIFSCNTYWFRRVDWPGWIANETVYMSDWNNMMRLSVAKWLRMDFDFV